MGPSAALMQTKPITPSMVDSEQALKASKALVAYIKKEAAQKELEKRNLLDEGDGEEPTSVAETPIWLTLTTKHHILDSKRLKPHRIILPYPLNISSEATICLITTNPQRAYKNIVASETFPAELRNRVTRVIDFSKLRAKFKTYEQQRKLYSEHDVFLGDDRIINRLPKVLGKTFYKTTAKRPIPVVFQKPRQNVNGKRLKRDKGNDEINAKPPAEIAAEIEKAVGAALVNLSPSTNTAIKCGYAGWKPAELAANIEALAQTLVHKFVPQKWQNVRSIYIKGPETIALPIWQTDELWTEDKDVLQEGSEELKALEAKKEKANVGKKRKSLDSPEEAKKDPPSKKAKLPPSNDDKLDQEIAERKAKLKKQKSAAKMAMED